MSGRDENGLDDGFETLSEATARRRRNKRELRMAFAFACLMGLVGVGLLVAAIWRA